jgi:hypothetical protein
MHAGKVLFWVTCAVATAAAAAAAARVMGLAAGSGHSHAVRVDVLVCMRHHVAAVGVAGMPAAQSLKQIGQSTPPVQNEPT